MQSYTQAFHDAISSTNREIRGYIKFNNTFTLDGAGGLISFKTTQNAMDAERFCAGSVASAFCEANFYNSGLEGSGVSLANSYFDAYIGVVTDATNNTVEYVCCGRYYISEISRGAATTKIVGYDIAGRLSMDYVPTVTADPTNGYLVMDILNDIISQTGVNGGTPFTTFGDDVYVPEIYSGNCRAQWGWLCSLVSAKAASYSGTREPSDLGYIKEYYAGNGVATPYTVDESTTYMDGLSLGDAFTITSFTTGTTENPIVIGTGTGIYGLNPYMDNTTATTIENGMHNYAYYPATLRWRGDPALDILDEVNVAQGQNTYKVVVMKIETTFNGGLEQTITCWGDSESYYALSTSPTQGQINRVSNMVQEIQEAIETADGGVITKILDTDGTWKELVIANNQDLSQATSVWRFNINGLAHSNRYQGGTYTLAMDTQGRIVANVIQTGVLQDSAGKNSWNLDTGAFTITNGSISISTESGTDDRIQLNYVDGNGARHSTFISPTFVTVSETPAGQQYSDLDVTVGAYGISVGYHHWQSGSGYAGSPTTRLTPYNLKFTGFDDSTISTLGYPTIFRMLELSGNQINLYDSSDTLRQKLTGAGNLWQYDANGTERTFIQSDGTISLSNGSGTLRQKLDGNGKLWQYDTNGKERTYLEYGDIYLKDLNEVTRSRLSTGMLRFFNASGTMVADYPATHPAPVDKANLTAVSARGEVLGGYAYRIGNAVLISFHFRASATAANSPGIADVSLLPDQDCALSCIDITNGIENAIEASVPCGVRYNGKIYLKTITAGHIYAITGVYPIRAA